MKKKKRNNSAPSQSQGKPFVPKDQRRVQSLRSASQGKAGNVMNRVKTFWIFITVFFFSGLCGLIYEVVWGRLLTLVFGNTTYAISTVVGVFMFGLALGSYLCGKLLPRITNLFKAYAIIEIGIGIYAIISVPLLAVVHMIHAGLFPSLYASPLLLNLIRIVLSFSLLFIPTLLMGATMPLLSQALTRSPRFIGGDIGILYAFNTLGAAAGCFFSAFLFIPALGLQVTILTGAVVNLIIGYLVWAMSATPSPRNKDVAKPSIAKPEVEIDEALRITRMQSRVILSIFMVSGFLALVYEVAWSRALILVFGSSIYAFATILTTYLLGIACGSMVLGRFMDRVHQPIFLLVLLQLVIGASVLLITPLIGSLPDYFLTSFSHHDLSWQAVAVREFMLCFFIIIIPTFASGACFPLVARLCMKYRSFQIGRTVADVYSFNTIGGIFGSLAAGFILIPVIGVERTLLFGGGANVIIASLLLTLVNDFKKRTRLVWGVVLALTGIAGAFVLPSWNPKVLNAGVYIYGKMMASLPGKHDVSDFMSKYELLYYREGASATVSVFQRDTVRFLRVNGKTDGSNAGDSYTEIFLGILPLMYSKNPQDVLVIGLGTGITLGSVLDYPIKKVDCVELSPEVVEASQYFNADNGFALRSPRAHVHVLDGRTWLMAMPGTYDIITSEPSHPWQTGNANLFTIDFFQLVRKKLNKGGIFCQWLPIYQMEQEHFQLLVSTFRKVFPSVHIWMANTDALLIGSTEELPPLDYREFQKRIALPAIKQRLAKVEVNTLDDLLSFFYLDTKAVDKFIEGVRGVNSDNYPVLEFSAPKYVLEKVKPDIFFAFLKFSLETKLPITNVNDAKMVQRKSMENRARYFRQWRIPEPIIQQMLSPR
jgi:spermidine synthase